MKKKSTKSVNRVNTIMTNLEKTHHGRGIKRSRDSHDNDVSLKLSFFGENKVREHCRKMVKSLCDGNEIGSETLQTSVETMCSQGISLNTMLLWVLYYYQQHCDVFDMHSVWMLQGRIRHEEPLRVRIASAFEIVVLTLLEKGADVNYQPSIFFKTTLLHSAIYARRFTFVSTLLRHPTIHTRIKDSHGWTARGVANYCGCIDLFPMFFS